jgi:hypothetical protein
MFFRQVLVLSDIFPQPFGVSYSGATYKYTVLDTTGQRAAAAGKLECFCVSVVDLLSPPVAQLPQTAYQSLLTPYSFIGLGRTNNYIENFFVGSTKHVKEHFINMEGVVPNSKVVIIPPPDDSQRTDWRKELYLRPGEWIPSRNTYGRDCDCALGDHCARSTLEREGGIRLYLIPSTILNQFTERGRARKEKSFSPHQFRRTIDPAAIYPMYDLLALRLLTCPRNTSHHGLL